MPAKKTILATGGTGGHIFPAMAVAESLLKLGAKPSFYTDVRFANYKPPEMEEMLKDIPVKVVASGRSGGGIKTRIVNLLGVVRGIQQAAHLLRNDKPDMVVGFGGYPSLPTMLAARLLGIPTLLHEQNAYLGRSNRLLAAGAKAVFTSHPNTHGMPTVAAKKTNYVGNPVRQGVMVAGETPYPVRDASTPLHVLVIGGSQGAKIFGDILPDALARLDEPERALIKLVQQVRPEAVDDVKARYGAMGVEAECASFFPDIAGRMAAAHLVVSRAGASSVAECSVAGRPAIYIPLPSAMDNHQWYNAQAAAEEGAAWRVAQVELSAERLADMLRRAIAQPDELTTMAKNAKKLGVPDAADTLAEHILAACNKS